MNKNNLRATVYLFFILSGMTGLIFQVSWFKYLVLFLGNTTYSQTILLSTFLGGLAIGNYIIGKITDKLKNQLIYYGIIELIIGIYCIFFPFIISLAEKFFYSIVNENFLLGNFSIYLIIKFIISIKILIIPTILMGGTLPLLTKYFTERIENIRKENASLYFLNSFGAVVGVFFAGFVLIKNFGLDTTVQIGAIINILIGGISILISSLNIKDETISTESFNEIELNVSKLPLSETTIKLVILVGGLSGFASFMYEILWTRILITIFGSSTYSFSIMLIAFISGITLGSFIVSSKFISKYDRFNLLIISQLSIALTIALSLLILPYLPFYFWKLSSLFAKTNSAFSVFITFEFFICFLLMFIPTIFMGISLPLVVEIVAKHKKLVGYSVGTVFSVNTLGNVLGSISVGLIFIPLIGLKNSFLLGILLNLTSSALLFFSQMRSILPKMKFVSIIFASIILLFMIITPEWNKELMTSGVFRRLSEPPPATYKEYQRMFSGREIIFYKDGVGGNVSVIQTLDTIKQRILLINGKPDASSVGDMPTQLLIGHIPMFLHPNPEKILLVGFGSGSTTNAILKYNPKEVICCEISKEVIETAPLFSNVNENCLNDPRLKIVIEDAQSYLNIADKKFDVIISEPSNPWIAGIGNLFSKEYFQRCKEKLNPGGIMAQWFHIYEMDDEVLRLVLSTFASVFPYVQVWGGVQGDLILIGLDNDIKPDLNILLSKFQTPEVQANLNRIGINNLFTLLTTQYLSPENSFVLTHQNPINSNKKPLLEFLAPVAFYKGSTSSLVYQFDEKFDTLSSGLIVKDFVKRYKISEEDIAQTISYQTNVAKNHRFVYGLSRYLNQLNSSNLTAQISKFKTEEEMKIIKYDKWDLNEKLKINRSSRDLSVFFANQIISENLNASNFLYIFKVDEAAEIFQKFVRNDDFSKFQLYIQLSNIFFRNSQFDKAYDYFVKSEELLKKNPDFSERIDLSEFFYNFSTCAIYLDKPEKVIEYYIQLMNYNLNYEKKKFLSKRVEWKVLENKRSLSKAKHD